MSSSTINEVTQMTGNFGQKRSITGRINAQQTSMTTQMSIPRVLSGSQIKSGTTEYWNSQIGMIGERNTLYIYTDYQKDENDNDIPGIKVGDGRAYIQDLPFIDEDLRNSIMDHINNVSIHVSLAEKLSWWNKINVDDESEVVDGILTFNRL